MLQMLTRTKQYIHSYLLSLLKKDDAFAQSSQPWWKIHLKIFFLKKHLQHWRKPPLIAHLIASPSHIAVRIWQRLLPYNPTLLGVRPERKRYDTIDSEAIETELIHKMTHLCGEKSDNIEGYVTSGATEGNIFSAWAGRKWLENKKIPPQSQCLLKTSLTHFSIRKAADVVGIKDAVVGLNEETWGMSSESLIDTTKSLIQKGINGFLIPFTYGYTLTGTDDNLEEIIRTIRRLGEQYTNIHFYCWIDAALAGLVKPFLCKDFTPFRYPEVKTFIVDFHKFGSIPCPAGSILYRKELRKLIEQPIDYINRMDNTLLCSRTGIAPVVCWTIIERLGREGFIRKAKRNLRAKELFISKHFKMKGVRFITQKDSLILGLILEDDQEKNKKYFSDRFDLYFKDTEICFANKKQNLLMSKAFFINF